MTMAGTTPLQTVVDALRNHGCNPRQSREGQWSARCPNTPAHSNGDRNPSLSVGTGLDGRVLVSCHTGCSAELVLHALNLPWPAAFPPPATNGNGHRRRVVDRYDYVDVAGDLVFQVERLDPKGFRQRRPVGGDWAYNLQGVTQPPLYRADRVACAVLAGEDIWVVEGEKDVHALEREGLNATTCPMGAEKWRTWHTEALAGAGDIHIVADDDPKGHAHATTVRDALQPHVGAVHLYLPAQGHKDIAEHLGAGRGLDELRPWPTEPEPQEETEEEPVHRLRANLYIGRAILDLPPVEWLIDGVIQAGGLTVVYGPPKSYKTFVVLAMDLHIANGISWRGIETRRARSLYVVAEGAPGVGPRAEAWCEHTGGNLDNMAWITVAPNLYDQRFGADTDTIIDIALELGVENITVDTLARSIPGADENSAQDMGIFVANVDRVREATGAAVKAVHHTGKDQARGMRGSNALQGAVDTSLEVVGDQYAVNCRVVDQKNAASDGAWWWNPRRLGPSLYLEPTEGLQTSSSEVRDLNIMRQLFSIDTGSGVTRNDWRDAVVEREVAGKTTFSERVKVLADTGLVVNEGSENRARWRLSQAGLERVQDATR